MRWAYLEKIFWNYRCVVVRSKPIRWYVTSHSGISSRDVLFFKSAINVGGSCIVQKSLPISNLGVIAPWVHTPKMWRWATTLEKQRRLSIVLTFNLHGFSVCINVGQTNRLLANATPPLLLLPLSLSYTKATTILRHAIYEYFKVHRSATVRIYWW